MLCLVHEVAMAGHLGVRKTQFKVMWHFYWPHLHKDQFCFVIACFRMWLLNQEFDAKPPQCFYVYVLKIYLNSMSINRHAHSAPDSQNQNGPSTQFVQIR